MTDRERREILKDDELVTWAVQEAVARAIEEHRLLGNPIVVSRDGKIVWLSPEEIPPYQPRPRPVRGSRHR